MDDSEDVDGCVINVDKCIDIEGLAEDGVNMDDSKDNERLLEDGVDVDASEDIEKLPMYEPKVD